MSRILGAVALLAACVSLIQAQDTRGSIVGRVTDSTGGNLTNAEIRITNTATGVATTSRTNESGNYVAPYLVPGFYSVTTEVTGFKKFTRDGVQVRVNDTVQLDIQLTVGDVTESVDVKADTPLLSTAEASLGQVIDERRIMDLPLFSGNAMEFTLLAPGVTNATDMRLRKAPFNNAPSQASTDGNGLYNNEFNIDGVTNTYSDGTNVRVAFSPPQASISEFKVQTSSFDASIGHTMGASVNINSKGGSNELHGSVWEWLRNSAFDTPNIFQNRSGQKLPVYQDNRYGAAAGSPIIIPKLYNGRNRTFWHFTYEANKFGDPGSATSSVPRAAWRNGDFSDLLALGNNYQLYDPATIVARPDGTFGRSPLQGNVLAPSRIDPVGRALLNLYPLPNQGPPTATTDGRQNFFSTTKALEDYWTTIGRVDHTVTDKNRMFVRFHRDFWEEDKARSFSNNVNGVILNRINRAISFDDVHVFSPSFLVNVRYGLTQQEFPERRVSTGFDLTSLGFSKTLADLVPAGQATIPFTQIGSLTNLSPAESGDGVSASLVHTFVGAFTWLKGNHNVRFGPEFRLYRVFGDRHRDDISPNLNFSSEWARGPINTSTAPPVGAEMLVALLGIPGGNMTRSGSFAEQDKYFGLYIQDDWKVTRKLTLNLGLRAEHESAITERFDRSATSFLAGQVNPLSAQAIANYAANRQFADIPVSALKINGGLAFAGGSNGREFWDGQGITWLPRIGVAYQVRPSLVVRAGYGIFYGSIGSFKTQANLAGFSRQTPIEATNDSGLTFKTKLSNPLPTGLNAPLGAAGGLLTNVNQNITYFPTERVQPYAQRWSFGFQQEIKSFVGEVSYVANRGTRLAAQRNINGTPNQYLSTSPVRDQAQITFLGQTVPNPFFGLNPNFTSGNISREKLLQPYPHFGNIQYNDPNGYSWYHSLQSRLEKRFTRGFTLQMSHTWSKAMEATEYLNAADPMPYESLSTIDRAHRTTGSGIYELPFGKGRKFGAGMHPVLEFFAGGWQMAGAYQRQSGQPINWANIQITGDSTKLVLPSGQRNADRWFNTDIFNKVSTQALDKNVRTFPLRFSNVRFDSQRRWDFSLNKTFRVNERFKVRFRADTFNALNEPVLRGPEANPTNSNFGKITAQEPPRSFQFSLQVQF